MHNFNLGLFSKYRMELMGVATLLIIICHMYPNGVVMPTFVSYILANGGAGCDVFLFLSGFGICHSFALNRAKGKNVWHWYLKRYMRLFIPCALIIIPFNIYLAYPNACNWVGSLINASGLGFLFRAGSLWYVSCTLLLYLLTPVLDKLLHGKRKWKYVFILSVFSLIFGYFNFNEAALEPWQFCVQRFPNFFIGYALTEEIMQAKHNGNIWLLVVIPSVIAISCFMSNRLYETNFCYFWCQGLVILTVSTWIIDYIHSSQFHSFLKNVGKISLESYATNVILLPHFKYLSSFIDAYILDSGNWAYYWIATFVCVLISFGVHKISKLAFIV